MKKEYVLLKLVYYSDWESCNRSDMRQNWINFAAIIQLNSVRDGDSSTLTTVYTIYTDYIVYAAYTTYITYIAFTAHTVYTAYTV